jgi:hypothetical protein
MRSHKAVVRVSSTAFASAVALAWVLAGSGCESHNPTDQLGQAVAVGERPVAMEGNVLFFGGDVSATATVSRGIGKGTFKAGSGKKGAGPHSEMPDVSGMDNDEATAYYRARAAVGSPMPPVTLHLKLKNLTAKPLSIEIVDFDSDLGNFAVKPSILKLEAGVEMEPEPMISQMGVTSDDIPVRVTLKSGGKKETQFVHVKSLMQPAPAH